MPKPRQKPYPPSRIAATSIDTYAAIGTLGHAIFVAARLGTLSELAPLVRGYQPISSAPFDRDLELAVIDYDGVHALVFPCRRILGGCMNAESKVKLYGLRPTQWREWQV